MEIPLRTHLEFPFWLHQDYLFVLVAWPAHFSSTSVPNIYCTCAWVSPAFIHYIHERHRTNNQISTILHLLNITETLKYQPYNYVHNMLRLFDGRPNFSFIKNETKHVCYSEISIKRTHYKADTFIGQTVWRGTDCFALRSNYLRKKSL